MRKILVLRILFVSLLAIVVACSLPLALSAEESRPEKSSPTTEERHQMTQSERTQTEREHTQTKLHDAKLRVCQNWQKLITTIMSRIVEREQKHINLISTIAERVEHFYAIKGRVVANYDTLVAEVATKKDSAQVAVNAIKASSTTFNCDADDPKGIANTFKESVRQAAAAIAAYKTAVKNLIVAVKSAQGTASGEGQ